MERESLTAGQLEQLQSEGVAWAIERIPAAGGCKAVDELNNRSPRCERRQHRGGVRGRAGDVDRNQRRLVVRERRQCFLRHSRRQARRAVPRALRRVAGDAGSQGPRRCGGLGGGQGVRAVGVRDAGRGAAQHRRSLRGAAPPVLRPPRRCRTSSTSIAWLMRNTASAPPSSSFSSSSEPLPEAATCLIWAKSAIPRQLGC